MMNTRTKLAALAASTLLLAGCAASPARQDDTAKPDVAACKAAMKVQFQEGMATPGGPTGSKPQACVGVDDATLQRLVGEILAEALEG